MARVSCQARSILNATSRDAPPNLVNLEYNEELSPDGNFDFSNFLTGKITLEDNTSPGRDHRKDKNGFTPSTQSSLSVLARVEFKPIQQCEDSNREVDSSLLNLLNTSEVKIRDQKPTDFSDSLCATFNNNSNSMKLKDNAEFEVDGPSSDLFSFTVQGSDLSVRSDHGRSVSPVCNINLSDITIPELCQDENVKVSNGKNINNSSEFDFNFSDILSSICIDDRNKHASKSANESSHCNQSLCLDDFKIDEVKITALNDKKENTGIDISQNFFDFTDAILNKETSCMKPNNDGTRFNNTYKSSTERNDVGFSFFPKKSNDQENLDGFNIQDLVRNINVRNDSSLGTSVDSTKSNGFSFFLDDSENQLTFSQMLDDDNRNVNKAQRSDSSSDQDSISMLDLINSLQSSKQGSSASESSGFLDEMEKKDGSAWLSSTPDDDDDDDDLVMAAIDLSTCIKSFEDKTGCNPQQTREIDATDGNYQIAPEYLYEDNPVLSLPLRNSVNPQAPRMNLKQSLFAKALSCKSKKDPVLAHKVANIKIELFNKAFSRSVPVMKIKEKCPSVEVAIYSDKSIIQFKGRRNFEPTMGVSCIASIS